MAILCAVPAENGCYTPVPFVFDPVPLDPGPLLERDLALYGDLCRLCLDLLPTYLMLLFMGPSALGLFERRAACREDWSAFQAAFTRRYPDSLLRLSCARMAVSALATGPRAGATRQWSPTFPEVLLGTALITTAPAHVRITGDAALPIQRSRTGHVRRADFALTSNAIKGVTSHAEVVGMLDRRWTPRTMNGADYAKNLPGRLQRYTEAGIALPAVVFIDELVDPDLRCQAVQRVLKPVVNRG